MSGLDVSKIVEMDPEFLEYARKCEEARAYRHAMSKRGRRKIEPCWFKSPIDLPKQKIGGIEIKHRMVTGSTPIIGMRQAFLRGVMPATAVLKEPLRVHELRSRSHGVWMTDLPEELFQIHEMVERTRPAGRVLVGGLGLGILAKVLVSQGEVDEVVVVERDPRVIQLCAQPGYEVIQADIFEHLEKDHRPYDYYLLDTWQGTGEATWWEEVMPQRRIIRNKWGSRPVIHCWAEDIMVGQVLQTIHMGSRGWCMEGLPKEMSLPEIEWFLSKVGTPKWERVYGHLYQHRREPWTRASSK